MKTRKFDGHDFYYEEGMSQLDGYAMHESEPRFGNIPELWGCEMIVKYLKKDWSFLDVGAHFGQFGMVAAKRTTGKVYCFEPIREAFEVLKKNCEVFDNMVPYDCALLDTCGKANFHIIKDNIYCGSHKIHGNGQYEIEGHALDGFNLKIDMMNIDVEGSGDKLLKGAGRTLEDTKVIIFEAHEEEKEYKDILRDAGFDLKDSGVHVHRYIAVKNNG